MRIARHRTGVVAKLNASQVAHQ